MNTKWLAILTGLFLASPLFAQNATVLKTDQDKVNYGIGVGVARNFKRQGMQVDVNLVVRGLRDALSGGKLLLSEDELGKIMTAYQNELIEKQSQATKLASDKNKKEGAAFLAENGKKTGVVTQPSGLQYRILKLGNGKLPKKTDTVECHYRGTLIDVTEFDSSYRAEKPVMLTVEGGLIRGWTEALQLMPVGSKWQLVIPPSLLMESGERVTRSDRTRP